MLLETLSNPDIVLEEKDKEQNMFHERPSSYLFVKTFQKEDGSKYVHFESVTVLQDGMEVSISSHIIRKNQLKNKLKSDRLLYKATALDAPANTSAEQPIVSGSLLYNMYHPCVTESLRLSLSSVFCAKIIFLSRSCFSSSPTLLSS